MLSDRVLNLKPSPTLAMAAKARELKAEGHDVISLSVGEPDWDTFENIKEAGIQALRDGVTKYTPASGLVELREAIAKQTNSDLGTDYSSAQVTVSAGGKFIIFSAFHALLNPGDEVIIPAPYWVSYPTMAELAGGVPVIVDCGAETNFKMTADQLEKAITPKTKILVLNSPSNPTGCLYSSGELNTLAQVLKKHPKVIIISDDIYNRLVFLPSGLSPHILQENLDLVERSLVLNGVSKTYSMTGWRVGWALGPSEIIGAMNRYQSQSVSCAPSFAQKAAICAIEDTTQEQATAVSALKQRRDFAVAGFAKMEHVEVTVPEGAFYLWPDFSYFTGKTFEGKKIESTRDLANLLLADKKVATVPGIEFGLEGFLRISYALSEARMTEALKRINDFLMSLKD